MSVHHIVTLHLQLSVQCKRLSAIRSAQILQSGEAVCSGWGWKRSKLVLLSWSHDQWLALKEKQMKTMGHTSVVCSVCGPHCSLQAALYTNVSLEWSYFIRGTQKSHSLLTERYWLKAAFIVIMLGQIQIRHIICQCKAIILEACVRTVPAPEMCTVIKLKEHLTLLVCYSLFSKLLKC